MYHPTKEVILIPVTPEYPETKTMEKKTEEKIEISAEIPKSKSKEPEQEVSGPIETSISKSIEKSAETEQISKPTKVKQEISKHTEIKTEPLKREINKPTPLKQQIKESSPIIAEPTEPIYSEKVMPSYNPTVENFPGYPQKGTGGEEKEEKEEEKKKPEAISIVLPGVSLPKTKTVEKAKPHPKTKEMPIVFTKVDTYNPKYLEMLQSDVDKYTLAFKNLDLFPEIEIDKELYLLSEKRLRDIVVLFPDLELIKPRVKCSPIIDLDEKVALDCFHFLTPIFQKEDQVRLLRKLEPRLSDPKPLYRTKMEIVVNNAHKTDDNIISDEADELAEGSKILSWIENNLVMYGGCNSEIYRKFMFVDLISLQNRGHIYLAKAGVNIFHENIVTENLVKLRILSDKYGRPINDAELMIYFTQNLEQGIIGSIDEIKKEAGQLLALEYFICLQPNPKFLLYILKRLVIAWYADIDLITSITKVRLLINQYRARRDKPDNVKLGVLPSIMIYLRYGVINFARAMTKINYYFTHLVNTGWIGNNPDYFTKYNDLIYYSNGSPDTKRFFEHLPDRAKMQIYKGFTINPTAFFKYGKEFISPFPQPYPKLELLKYRSKFDLKEQKRKLGKAIPTIEVERKQEEARLKKQIVLEKLEQLRQKTIQ